MPGLACSHNSPQSVLLLQCPLSTFLKSFVKPSLASQPAWVASLLRLPLEAGDCHCCCNGVFWKAGSAVNHLCVLHCSLCGRWAGVGLGSHTDVHLKPGPATYWLSGPEPVATSSASTSPPAQWESYMEPNFGAVTECH